MMQRDTITSRGEQTRQAILDSAEGLFLTQGYNGTSIRQIARRAGRIAVGSIYNYFDGKEGIFRALLEDRSPYDDLLEVLESLEGDLGADLIAQAFTRIQGIMQHNISFIGLVMIDFQEFEGATMRALASHVIPSVMAFGRRLRNATDLRDDLDEFVILRYFVSLVIGSMMTRLVAFKDNQPVWPDIPNLNDVEWQTIMTNMFLYGIAKDEDHD